ncbi:hypothetical protein GCM10011309_05810 [Litorimonas cladophorae]|uniref:Uncharacterized protein n=1 Tax=Litorimonas cladophorae TaxID=1220491 RepID=A0A918KFE8_9PROT|nr:hypothetical protein [Litorimonas cladophorae]GGX59103.1 hypothetical protein GCM10011309_05810 [Litorimonas cladophorae]
MSIKKIALAGGVAASLMAGTAYASVIDRPFFQVLGVVVVWGADDAATAAPVVSDFVLLTPASGSAGADLIGGQNVNTVITGSLTPVDGTGPAASGTATNPVTGATSGGALTDAAGVGAGILDASDSLSAFGIDGSTDVSGLTSSHTSSFFVASNAAFDINAVAGGLAKTGDFAADTDIGLEDISLKMSFDTTGVANTVGGLTYGANSQDPGAFVGGVETATGTDLSVVAAAGATGLKVFDGTQRTAATPGSLADQSVRFDNVYDFGGASGYDLSMGSGTISAQVTYTIFVP